MKISSKLDKLKMPEKKPMMTEESGSEPDNMGSVEGDDMGEEEGPNDATMDEAGTTEDLTQISDDDLMAEMKKRGLMSKLMGHPDDESQHPQDDGMV